MATWINKTEGWKWGGGDSKFCSATADFFLHYSLSLRSYRLQHRSTFLWSPFWFTKEFVAANRTPGDGYVINAVIKLNKEREDREDYWEGITRRMNDVRKGVHPVWKVTPKREEDREVANYAETLINYMYAKEPNMEVIDKRTNGCTLPTIPLVAVPNGAVFQGTINSHLTKLSGTFKRVRDHVVELSGGSDPRMWEVNGVTMEKTPYFVANYQRVHGKIVIERNA